MKRCIIFLAALMLSVCASAQTQPCTNGFTQITSNLTTTLYSDSTVADGQTYVYMVTSNNAAGFACSGLSTLQTIPSTGTHSVSLSWNPSTTSGVTYAVFRAQTPAPPGTPTGAIF